MKIRLLLRVKGKVCNVWEGNFGCICVFLGYLECKGLGGLCCYSGLRVFEGRVWVFVFCFDCYI